MYVGTPGQRMSVALDVTSRLSYVPSVNCTDPFCTSHRQYDSSASSTYVVSLHIAEINEDVIKEDSDKRDKSELHVDVWLENNMSNTC